MLDTTDTMDLMLAFKYGEKNAQMVADGGPPDISSLERFAQAMEALRVGVANGTLCFGWVRPTEEDVRTAERLVQLAREGAPKEALREPAYRTYCATADPNALYTLACLLPWLAGERVRDIPSPDNAKMRLDLAIAFFERGGNVSGFVPTPDDSTRVRRLRDLVTDDSAEGRQERQRLAVELWARLPQDNISEGAWRTAIAH